MKQVELLARIAQGLESAGIPFMVAGSHSSSYYGQPRATNDADLVIDPTSEQLDRFLALLGDGYYVSKEAARDAVQQRSMFNIIDLVDGWKADLIIRKDRPFSIEEFRRKKMVMIRGYSLPFASPEDIILTKLEWNRITPSERQLRDALNVVIAQWPTLDQTYLRKWAPLLGVKDYLEELLRAGAEAQPPSNP